MFGPYNAITGHDAGLVNAKSDFRRNRISKFLGTTLCRYVPNAVCRLGDDFHSDTLYFITIQDDGGYMKLATLDNLNSNLAAILRDSNGEDILITQGGKPTGVLVGFSSEDECYDYLLKNDPELLQKLFRSDSQG